MKRLRILLFLIFLSILSAAAFGLTTQLTTVTNVNSVTKAQPTTVSTAFVVADYGSVNNGTTYIKINNSAIPQNAQITSYLINLSWPNTGIYNCNGDDAIYAYRLYNISSNWTFYNGSTINYNNQPCGPAPNYNNGNCNTTPEGNTTEPGARRVYLNFTEQINNYHSSGIYNLSYQLRLNKIEAQMCTFASSGTVSSNTLITYSIPSHEYNISTCSILNDQDSIYYLSSDILESSTNYCMQVTANNVTLDCQGYTIDGNDAADYGIYSNGVNNLTIRNCTFSDWDNQAAYILSSNALIRDTRFLSNPGEAIYAVSSSLSLDNTNVSGSSLYSNSYGIDSLNSYVVMNNSNIFSNTYGFYANGYNFSFYNSRIFNNTKYEIYANTNNIHCDNKLENVNGTNNLPIIFLNQNTNLSGFNSNFSELVLCGETNNIVFYLNNMTMTGEPLFKNNGIFAIATGNISLYISNSSLRSLRYGVQVYSSSGYLEFTNNSCADTNQSCIYSQVSQTRIYNNYFRNISQAIELRDITATFLDYLVYNNYFNTTSFPLYYPTGYHDPVSLNITKQLGDRVYSNGKYIAGNYWANTSGTGYSQICDDTDFNGFCDSILRAEQPPLSYDIYDYLPYSSFYDNLQPGCTGIHNNASSTRFNQSVMYYANITDSGYNYTQDSSSKFSTYTFSSNSTGAWLNYTFDISGSSYNIAISNVTNQTRGNTVCAQFFFNDSNDNRNNTNMTCFVVANSPPIATVLINNKPIGVSKDLNITTNYSDIDKDFKVANETWWFNNSVHLPLLDNLTTIGKGNLSSDDVWTASQRYFDGYDWGDWVNDSVVIGDITPPIVNHIAVSSIIPYTTDSVTFYANVTDNSGNVPVGACTFQLRKSDFNLGNAFNLTTNSVSNTAHTITQTMAVFGTGILEFQKSFCVDVSGNMEINSSVGINVSISVYSPTGGSSGSSGPSTNTKDIQQSVQAAINQTVICGNNICQEGENPLVCSQDCGINVDSIMCPLYGNQDCPAWVFNFLIYGIIGSVIFVTYKNQTQGRRKK